MRMRMIGLGALALSAFLLAAAGSGEPSDGSSLAAPGRAVRPAADIERDAARRPVEIVEFAEIGPGQTIVDLIPGGGYFTRIFSIAVEPEGKVVALVADALAARNPKARTDIEALAAEAGYENIEAAIRPLSDVGAPGTVDRVFTAQNYHDLKSQNLPANVADGVNRAVFAALKPGGFYVIIDHSAEAGSGLRDVDTLHRIDAATVKAEVEAAGFKFAGESAALANPADDRTKPVFDPAIRGQTDQFVYRFIKPVE